MCILDRKAGCSNILLFCLTKVVHIGQYIPLASQGLQCPSSSEEWHKLLVFILDQGSPKLTKQWQERWQSSTYSMYSIWEPLMGCTLKLNSHCRIPWITSTGEAATHLNVKPCGNYKYCFMDAAVKLPVSVHNSRIFENSTLNEKLRNGKYPHAWRIVDNEEPVPVFLLCDRLMLYMIKEYANGGSSRQEQYFGLNLCSVRNHIKCWLIEGQISGTKKSEGESSWAIAQPLEIINNLYPACFNPLLFLNW